MDGDGLTMPLVKVAVELPKHGALDDILDYQSEHSLVPGTIVRVPLGQRVVRGIVWGPSAGPDPLALDQAFKVRAIDSVADALPPLSPAWRDLVSFAAGYYQRGVGELALACLPPALRGLTDAQLARAWRKVAAKADAAAAAKDAPAQDSDVPPELTQEQAAVLAALMPALNQGSGQAGEAAPKAGATTTLLHGVTGSGKTEVYLRAAQAALAAGRQVLVLVPEINLTPQLESRFARRFGQHHRMVSLHSALTPAQRLGHWLSAHAGTARLVLGTRLAVFASMPQLGLIVVDEEHDPSFKQQEGARYSARDLAVWRGRHEGVPVVLGSATPSLESWKRAQDGHYQKLELRERVGAGVLPRVRLLDMNALPREVQRASPVAPAVLDALRERVARGEQSLVLLNRRGYTPVLHCTSCGWKSDCPHCSAWRVFHKVDRTLRCHHCGMTSRVPKACPECGDLDIGGLGRGTQKLEEQLQHALPNARVARIDADTVRLKGALESQLTAMHAGDVDVLVGTQMVAKGHDFRRITLVVSVDPDGALFTSDFRAPERLFALLMQAAGRAGRDAAQAQASEMWVQTWHPTHALYAALVKHDFHAFAQSQLDERAQAGMPPFSSMALLRADAKTVDAAEAFLCDAAAIAAEWLAGHAGITVYPPVPLHVARVADVERMQMVVESQSRQALQQLLAMWHAPLQRLRTQHKGVIRFAVDVDPMAI